MNNELIRGTLSAEVTFRYADGRTITYKIPYCKTATVKTGSVIDIGHKVEIRIGADAMKVEHKGWPVTIDAEPTAHVQTKGILPAPSGETQAPEYAHVQHKFQADGSIVSDYEWFE